MGSRKWLAVQQARVEQPEYAHMMNSRSNSRIVIAAGMAVVVGIGAFAFVQRVQHDKMVAQAAPAPVPLGPTQPQTAPPDQAAAAQAPADQTASAAAPDTAAPAAVEPKAATTPSSAPSDRHLAKARASDSKASIRVASAAKSASPSEPATGAAADAQDASASAADVASSVEPASSSPPMASDSQITSAVKSQISGSSASNNVDVSTTNGVVALAGSMPSQDAIDQVKQAAQSVNGVKHVDTSALVVSGN
jgi:osmotically-inducible protein OsmY